MTLFDSLQFTKIFSENACSFYSSKILAPGLGKQGKCRSLSLLFVVSITNQATQ
jgi:hypothetical protein